MSRHLCLMTGLIVLSRWMKYLMGMSRPEYILQGEAFLQSIFGSMEAGNFVGGRQVARGSQRRKIVWQAWQEEALLSVFSKSKYLSFAERQDLARRLGVPDSRIRVWFQNRRSRTGAVGQAPRRPTRGSSRLSPEQLQEELGSRAQGGGMPSDRGRPRTRITSPQLRILEQAFEKNPRPGFTTREELAQRTGLLEDTIHIWFQNRRARQGSRRRHAAQDKGVLTCTEPDGREREGAQDSLLALAPAGSMGMDTSSPSDLPTVCTESQPSQLEESSGPVQEEAPTQASNTDPLEFLLDQLLTEVSVQEHGPDPLDLETMDTVCELPLTQEEYQALLDML